jgi:hypothetical protein
MPQTFEEAATIGLSIAQQLIDYTTTNYNTYVTICNELQTEIVSDPSLQNLYDSSVITRDNLLIEKNNAIAAMTTLQTTLDNVTIFAKNKYDELMFDYPNVCIPPRIWNFNLKDAFINKIIEYEGKSCFCDTTKCTIIQKLLNSYNPANYPDNS